MGRKSAKSKEKKHQRKEFNAKYAASLALVEAASQLNDPMESIQAFKNFDRNGINVTIACKKADDVEKGIQDWVFSLTKQNMKQLYEDGGWGWRDKDKRDEMFDDRAWYLIARSSVDNKPLGFVHFRFDMDFEDEVLYCYEIQLEEDARRKGLGKFLMQILEMMAFKTKMRKVMLTVFKNNEAGQKFFLNTLKYSVDETSPEGGVWEDYSYEILSKHIGVKKVLETSQTANVDITDS